MTDITRLWASSLILASSRRRHAGRSVQIIKTLSGREVAVLGSSIVFVSLLLSPQFEQVFILAPLEGWFRRR